VKVLAVSNSKGGSAKTTTSIHIGAALARAGLQTLVIDMDPQGHVGEGLNFPYDGYEPDITQVIERKCQLSDAIKPGIRDHLDIVPATDELAFTESDLREQYHREDRLKTALATVQDYYDWVVIDCPPYFNLLTINAMSAADQVLIPMVSEYFALRGVDRLLGKIDQIQIEINPELAVLGILFTRVGRTINAREILELARGRFEETVRVFDITVPETVKFREAAALGKTIFEIAPESPGSAAYIELVSEVLIHGR
jgi:chromosome partitioning protein